MDNYTHIDELIGKFLAGEASPEEALELEDWKALGNENLRYWDECLALHEITSPGLTTSAVNTDAAWEKMQSLLQQQPTETPVVSIAPPARKRQTWRIAAGVVLVLGLGALFTTIYKSNSGPELPDYYAAMGVPIKGVLQDSSVFSLEPNSRIDIRFNKNERRIAMSGRGFFSVKHDESKPFIIEAGSVQIKDIGTAFRVEAVPGNDTVLVSVSEGIVELSATGTNTLRLEARESGRFLQSQRRFEKIVPETVHENSRVLSFHNHSLNEVIASIEKTYGTKITLDDPKLGDCMITVDFHDEELDTVITIISETLSLHADKTANGYTLYGKGCH